MLIYLARICLKIENVKSMDMFDSGSMGSYRWLLNISHLETKMIRVWTLLLLIGFSSQSMALFDVQLLAGYRLMDFKAPQSEDAELSGLSVTAAFHLSPVPLLPVGAGLAVEYLNFNAEKWKDVSESDGFVFIPEIIAWLPIDLLSVTPYAKLGYAFGTLKFGGDAGIEGSTDTSGVRLSVGAKWQPKFLPLIKFLLQGDYGFTKTKIEDLRTNGTDTAVDKGDKDSGNFAIAAGLEIGI